MTEDIRRRSLLQMLGVAATTAGAVPASIARALEVPAHHRKGSIEDVQHIIVLMQENRSFDHYFGTMRGVRGFADPRAVRLPSGRPVWNQPDARGEVLPFRPSVDHLGGIFLPDPPHGWNDTHAAWNGGRHDQFVPNKGLSAMTYHLRDDLPYHFALADAFTVCDAYHCSVMGPTDPNRYHLWSGWVGNDGGGGGPVITNAEAGYDWHTFPERLQAAGIPWKVYQDTGTGLTAEGAWGWTGQDPYIGNYGDNALLYFHQYQNAQPGNPLADRAKTGTTIQGQGRDPLRLLDIFRADVQAGRLPQVSYLVTPEAYSEHPNFPGDFGAWYISQVMDILAANPDVFSKTVLFINYDEEGGFFDHVVPPTPATGNGDGGSTVATTNEIYPGDANHPSAPYGLGMRVPMLVVSPWSKGGWVNSQVFDHTSVIRFIEARFQREAPGLLESNITPWRRAVAGDLLSAFDFSQPERWRERLPSTAAYLPVDLVRQPDAALAVPAQQALPRQEPGVRPARALPYSLAAHAVLDEASGELRVEMANDGSATAVLQARSGFAGHAPRSYTIEPGKSLTGVWHLKAAGLASYDLEVRGPNGFFRAFKGTLGAAAHAQVKVRAEASEDGDGLRLQLHNAGTQTARVSIQDSYSRRSHVLEMRAGAAASSHWSLEHQARWYDLQVIVEGDTRFGVQLAGHLENGEPGISDPALGGLTLKRR